jgi:hypothetical protein
MFTASGLYGLAFYYTLLIFKIQAQYLIYVTSLKRYRNFRAPSLSLIDLWSVPKCCTLTHFMSHIHTFLVMFCLQQVYECYTPCVC